MKKNRKKERTIIQDKKQKLIQEILKAEEYYGVTIGEVNGKRVKNYESCNE